MFTTNVINCFLIAKSLLRRSTCSEIMAAGVFPDISVPPTPPPPRPPSPPANPATVLASAALFTATTAVDEPARLPGEAVLSSPMPESSGLAFVELSSPPPSARCANPFGKTEQCVLFTELVALAISDNITTDRYTQFFYKGHSSLVP